MKVEAEIKVLIVFVAHNKDYCMGCYYPEDDWDIRVIADNMAELEERVTQEMVSTGIVITSAELYSAEYLIYKEYQFCVGKVTDIDEKYFLDKIYDSDLYKTLKEEKKAEKEKQAATERKKYDIRRLEELNREMMSIKDRLKNEE